MAKVDAVVIGAGPNGSVAANHLVDAGWSVLVLEAQPVVGGAVRSADGRALRGSCTTPSAPSTRWRRRRAPSECSTSRSTG